MPTITSGVGGYAQSSIFDYMGLPIGVASVTTNSLPLRAYNLVWNEWFRDENLQNSVVKNTGNGPDATTDYALLQRGKRHDYFTSCLPWPQKGTAVSLPLGTSAPVVTNSTVPTVTGGSVTNANLVVNNATLSRIDVAGGSSSTGNMIWGNNSGLIADLSSATAATINQLRQAFQIQRMYERDARRW